jgi:hypothetical protein
MLTAETLGRYLAAEISLRESGEERTAGALARYFKLTLVLAGLNMVVATASVVMLFSRVDKPPTIVVAPPVPVAAPAPQPLPVEHVVAPETVSPAPTSPALPAALPPAPSPPSRARMLDPPAPASRMPLLGQPPSASRRAAMASAPRAPRVASPKPPTSLILAKNVAEETPPAAPSPAVSQATERW